MEDKQVKELLDQVKSLTLMVVDLTIRTTSLEKLLFESGVVKPGEFADSVKQVSDEFGKNVENVMKGLENAEGS